MSGIPEPGKPHPWAIHDAFPFHHLNEMEEWVGLIRCGAGRVPHRRLVDAGWESNESHGWVGEYFVQMDDPIWAALRTNPLCHPEPTPG